MRAYVRKLDVSIYELPVCRPVLLRSWSWRRLKAKRYLIHVHKDGRVEVRRIS